MDDDAFMKYDGTQEGGFVGHGALKEVYLGMVLHKVYAKKSFKIGPKTLFNKKLYKIGSTNYSDTFKKFQKRI